MKDRLFEIWFALRCGAGNREFQPLLETYGTAYDLFNAEAGEIEKMPCSRGLKNRLADKSLAEATRIMEYCKANGVQILFWQDAEYPAALRPLRDPPVLLYCKGRLPDLSRRLCISVVGTRRMSEYGKRMAYKIGYELGAAGAVVVSGMALGNDSVATAGAIAANGQTVAILGSGIDVIYPREHERLYEEILRHGAILTEYPPATPPAKQNFPIRNRLISGLSRGTLVVEGDLRSGALITARTAIVQGRDIYALPGNVGSVTAEGTNRLISDGAAVVLSARDVLENYAFLYRDTLNMSLLRTAETRSEPDDDCLERLGICARIPSDDMKAEAEASNRPNPAETPNPTAQGRTRAPFRSPFRRPDPMSEAQATPPKTTPRRRTSEGGAPTPAPQNPPAPAVSRHGDASGRILQRLTETQRRIFEALPLDHAVPIDAITREGFSVGEVMAAMTILEIHGLTVTLPGGLYARK